MSLYEHKDARDNFIDNSKIPDVEDGEIYGTVYCIENILTGKLYIGATINFPRRVSEYIRFNQSPANYSTKLRIIDKAMIDDGIENFKIYPIRECASELNLAYWELYYIWKYNTMIPNGYNESFNTSGRVKARPKDKPYPKGIKPSASNRKKRSRPAIAINLDSRKMYISDSMKLLAKNVFNCDRSEVSHAARAGSTIRGYYVYYIDVLSANSDIDHAISLYSQAIDRRRNNNQYLELKDIIITEGLNFFKRNNFKIYTLEYSDDSDNRFILKEFNQ